MTPPKIRESREDDRFGRRLIAGLIILLITSSGTLIYTLTKIGVKLDYMITNHDDHVKDKDAHK